MAFQVGKLRKRGYDEAKVRSCMDRYDTLCNLQLLTASENVSKNPTPFEQWLTTRDEAFRKRHLIPDLPDYKFDRFLEFSDARTKQITAVLKSL